MHRQRQSIPARWQPFSLVPVTTKLSWAVFEYGSPGRSSCRDRCNARTAISLPAGRQIAIKNHTSLIAEHVMPSRDSVRAFGEVKAPPPAKEDLHLLQDISVSSTLTDESPAFPAWFPWALAAVLALVSISLAGLGARSRRESHEASDKLEQAQQSLAELERQYATLQDQFAALKKSQVGRISELERQLVQKAQETEKQKNELQKKIDNAAAEVLQIKRQHPVFQNHVGSTSKSLKRAGLDPANTLP